MWRLEMNDQGGYMIFSTATLPCLLEMNSPFISALIEPLSLIL